MAALLQNALDIAVRCSDWLAIPEDVIGELTSAANKLQYDAEARYVLQPFKGKNYFQSFLRLEFGQHEGIWQGISAVLKAAASKRIDVGVIVVAALIMKIVRNMVA